MKSWGVYCTEVCWVRELNLGEKLYSRSLRSAYRSPLKVVVQRLVQQRPLAASLCAHQRDVDVVIRPCEPLVPSGNGHRVTGHVRGDEVSGDEEEICRTPLATRLLPQNSLRWPDLTFLLAPVVTGKRLTCASVRVTGAPSALPLWGVTGGLHSHRKALWSTPAIHYLDITIICNTTELNHILHLCPCNYIHLDPPPHPDSRFFWTTGLTVNTSAPFRASYLTVKSVSGNIQEPVEYLQMFLMSHTQHRKTDSPFLDRGQWWEGW